MRAAGMDKHSGVVYGERLSDEADGSSERLVASRVAHMALQLSVDFDAETCDTVRRLNALTF